MPKTPQQTNKTTSTLCVLKVFRIRLKRQGVIRLNFKTALRIKDGFFTPINGCKATSPYRHFCNLNFYQHPLNRQIGNLVHLQKQRYCLFKMYCADFQGVHFSSLVKEVTFVTVKPIKSLYFYTIIKKEYYAYSKTYNIAV